MDRIESMSKTAKLVAGSCLAVVGLAAFAGLISHVQSSDSAVSKKKTKKSKKSKSGKAKKNKKKSSAKTPTKELSIEIEKACINEFKAYLPVMGKKEQQFYQQVRAQGQQMTQEIAAQIQETMIADLYKHLEDFKKELCKKHNISESKHDKLVAKYLDEKEPEFTKLMEESEKMWSIFKPEGANVEVPDHVTEDIAIEYICQSFKIVINSFETARKQFMGEGTVSDLKARMSVDDKLKQEFNSRFNEIVAAGKQELMKKHGFESESMVAAIVNKFQNSPKFNKIVGEEKAKMDAFFGSGM